jgi:hypothetical protein
MDRFRTIKPYKWPASRKKKPGRPSKYRPDILKQVKAYLHLCGDNFDEQTKTWTVNLPRVEDFARRLDVSKDTLYTLAKTYWNYRSALERIKSAQLVQLAHGGLSGRYKVWYVKLLLKVNHGFNKRAFNEGF